MKCVITGHTTGLGKALFTYFKSQGWEVIGISRTTGINLLTDIDDAIEIIKGADLFINNAAVSNAQLTLLNKTYNLVGKTITMGSVAGDMFDLINEEYKSYAYNSHILEHRCLEISRNPLTTIVFLKLSMLEDAVSTDLPILYSEVIDTIAWWLNNPRITQFNFELKLTDYTIQKINDNLGILHIT
jgi:hypothetical protein